MRMGVRSRFGREAFPAKPISYGKKEYFNSMHTVQLNHCNTKSDSWLSNKRNFIDIFICLSLNGGDTAQY